MIEVSRLKDLNAAKLFFGFRIGAISGRDFAVFPVHGQRGLGRLKRYFGDKMSVGAQMVVVLKAFVEGCVALVLGHPFEFSRLDVSQADVFHRFLLVSCGPCFAATHSRCSSLRQPGDPAECPQFWMSQVMPLGSRDADRARATPIPARQAAIAASVVTAAQLLRQGSCY